MPQFIKSIAPKMVRFWCDEGAFWGILGGEIGANLVREGAPGAMGGDRVRFFHNGNPKSF